MVKKILYSSLSLLLFIHLFSTETLARRIRESDHRNLPATLHGFGVYLHDKIAEGKLPEKFTKQDIVNLTGWSEQAVHHKIILLTEIGVLELEEGRMLGGGRGREPNTYQLKSPFDKKDNLELLAAIKELYRGTFEEEERSQVVPIIRGKIEVIKKAIQLAAEGSLKVELSPELEKFPEVKMRFLIGLAGQPDLVELYKSFSSIKITKSGYPYGRVDVDYDPTKDEVSIILPDYPFEYVYYIDSPFRRIFGERNIPQALEADLMWNWLGSEFMHRELVYAVIAGSLKFEVTLTPAEDLFYKALTSSLFVVRMATSTSDFALLERFIIERNQPIIKPLFQEFISVYNKIIEAQLATFRPYLSETALKILSLRYGLGDGQPRTLKEVASILGLRREEIREIETKALEKLQEVIPPDITPYKTQIEEILSKVYSILYPD